MALDPSFDPTGYQPNVSFGTGLQSDDFSRWRLEVEAIVNEIEHYLKGETWIEEMDKNGNISSKWKRTPDSMPIMNEEGIRFIVSKMRMYLNKNLFLSNIDDDMVMELANNFHMNLNLQVLLSWEKWKFKKEYHYITRDITTNVFFALSRAKNEGERKSLTQQERTTRVINESQNQKKQGFGLPGLRPFGGPPQQPNW